MDKDKDHDEVSFLGYGQKAPGLALEGRSRVARPGRRRRHGPGQELTVGQKSPCSRSWRGELQ